jgi:hypothetical protein
MLARELYRVMKEVERLEKELNGLASGALKGNELERQLLAARAEETRIKAMLEGAKAG